MRRPIVFRAIAAGLCLVAAVVATWHAPGPSVLFLVALVGAAVVFVVLAVPLSFTIAAGCVVLAAAASLLFTPPAHGVPWRMLVIAVVVTGAVLVADAVEPLPAKANALLALALAVRRRALPLLVAAVTLAAATVLVAAPPGVHGLAAVLVGMGAVAVLVLLTVRHSRNPRA